MQLPGRLSTSTLGDLLGVLHREGTTGRLELLELRGPRGSGVPGRRHRIHLARGLVTFVESALEVLPLGELLRRDGLVATPAITWALRRADAGDPRALGEILVEEGLARAEFVRASLRKQQKLRLDALFDSVEDAVVAFRPARAAEEPAVKAGPLWPSDFLYGRPRRRDGVRAQQPEAQRARSRAAPAPLIEDERARARRLLGLDEAADAAEVRRAFRRLAIELHPDRHAMAPAEQQRRKAAQFARLSAAYHLLVA